MLYKTQVEQGRSFLHEHPASAMSWKVSEMEKLAAHPLVNTVVGDQCMYGLLTPSELDRDILAPAKKSTRFMSNYPVMLDQLKLRCDKTHSHQPLTGGRCADAARYPAKLVHAILKGMTLQKRQDSLRTASVKEELVPVHAMPMYEQGASAKYEFGEAKVDSVPKMTGGKLPVVLAGQKFKKRYT